MIAASWVALALLVVSAYALIAGRIARVLRRWDRMHADAVNPRAVGDPEYDVVRCPRIRTGRNKHFPVGPCECRGPWSYWSAMWPLWVVTECLMMLAEHLLVRPVRRLWSAGYKLGDPK